MLSQLTLARIHGTVIMDDDGASLFGLGFSSTSLATGSGGDSEGLLKGYMKECLQYHYEQEIMRKDINANSSFVPASSDSKHEMANDELKTKVQEPTAIESNEASPPNYEERQEQIRLGKLKAQAILQRFQRCQQEYPNGSDMAPSLHYQQRLACKERENKRREEALLKNFEYISRKLSVQLEEHKQKEDEVNLRYQTALQAREARITNVRSQAGIGTTKRTRVEQQKRQSQKAPRNLSVAFYITGLPLDGSLHSETLYSLFGSYGNVLKVHMYRRKDTGELKGDGLIVFELKDESEKEELSKMVCSQVRNLISMYN